MPKKLIHRFTPDAATLRHNKRLQCFGKLLHKPALWKINRHSIAAAFAVGLFFAWMPVPFQMVLAAGGAIYFNGNLPVSVSLVWLTNPFTMPPLFYIAYRVGAWVLGIPEQPFDMELSMDWALDGMMQVWQPFLLGCLIMAIFHAVVGYFGVKIGWRLLVAQKWRKRHSDHV